MNRTRGRTALATAALLLTVAAPAAYGTFDGGDTAPAVLHGGDTAPAALPGGDTAPAASPAPARGTPYVQTQLFFGTARPDGGPAVTERQFLAFVDAEVTPGFPAGLTVQRGHGQWRDATGTVEKERSYELILLYPVAAARTSDRRIEKIRRVYEKTFGQESVGRVDLRGDADF
jgi:hypothetical protein